MRILQVSDGYPPAVGGLERTVQALARELADRGHEVEVLTLSYPGTPAVEQEGAVTVRRLDGLTRHLQRFSSDPGHHFHPTTVDPSLVAAMNARIEAFGPDVVHAHGWIVNSCLSLDLPRGCALVTTLHDYGLTCVQKTLIEKQRYDHACVGPSLRRCLPCAPGTYGVAKGTALTLALAERRQRLDRVTLFLPITDAVARASLPEVAPERVRVIPSFVADDLDRTTAAPPDGVPDRPFLLFVGALGPHKGLDLLVEAQSIMTTPVPVVAIGPRRADTVIPPGTPARPVTVLSDVPHPQIMAAYAAATITVVPSRWPEPQGLVPIEAMAAGSPVVAARIGGLPEVVDDGAGELFRSGDAVDLAALLDQLMADPARRSDLVARGSQRWHRFAAATVLPQIIDAYHHALDLARA